MKKLFGTLRKGKDDEGSQSAPSTPAAVRPPALSTTSAAPAAATTTSGAGKGMDAYLESPDLPPKSQRAAALSAGAEADAKKATGASGRHALPAGFVTGAASQPSGRSSASVASDTPSDSPAQPRKLPGAVPAAGTGTTEGRVSPALPRKGTTATADAPASTGASGRFSVPAAATATSTTTTTTTTATTSAAAAVAKPAEVSRFSARRAAASTVAAGGPSATGASGRHAVPASATPNVTSAGGVSGRHAAPTVTAASLSAARQSGATVATAATTAVAAAAPDSPDDHEESDTDRTPLKTPTDKYFAETRETPVTKRVAARKKGAARRLPVKRLESFTTTNKFRQLEAVGRDETPELERFAAPSDMDEAFRVLPREVYRSYSELRDVARDANIELVTPEFVVFGLPGHGKTSVLEAILGWPCLHVDYEAPTRRPLHISVQNNSKFAEPRFTLMPDVSLGVTKRQVFSDYRELRKEIAARVNKTKDLLRTPVHVLIEHAEAVNFDLIECPGLHAFNSNDAAVSIVSELARPAHRTLVVVEESVEWSSLNRVLVETVLQLDPDCSRTIFVHTKLNTMLQGMYNSVNLSQYYTGLLRMRPVKSCFWLTSLSSKCRSACLNPEQFRLRLTQARLRDLQELRNLQCGVLDYEESVGAQALRAYMLRRVVACVRSRVPEIVYALNKIEATATQSFRTVLSHAEGLDTARAKAFGMVFVDGFIASIQDGVMGSLQARPEHYGETVADERFAGWTDDRLRPVGPAPSSMGSDATARLVGAQQFQRLQSDLSAVLLALDLDKLAVAAEFSLPAVTPASKADTLRLAAELVHSVMLRCVAPIFAQACTRAENILLHAFAVYDDAFSVRVAEETASSQWYILAHSPYFRSMVRERFLDFVAAKRRQLEQQLRDELLSPDTYVWAMLSNPAQYAPPAAKVKGHGAAKTIDLARTGATLRGDAPATSREVPAALKAELQAELLRVEQEHNARNWAPRSVAKRLFAVQIKRVSTNARLKLFHHLLEPLHDELHEHLRLVVDKLDPDEVSGLFSIASVQDQYAVRKAGLQRALDQLANTKHTYAGASASFLRTVGANP